jgi:hypothetical protein
MLKQNNDPLLELKPPRKHLNKIYRFFGILLIFLCTASLTLTVIIRPSERQPLWITALCSQSCAILVSIVQYFGKAWKNSKS